jgi:hypothetical protein
VLNTAIGDLRLLASVYGPGDRRLVAVAPGDVKAAVRYLYRLTESSSAEVWPRSTEHN